MRANRDHEPSYAGASISFMKVPLALEEHELQGADVVILGAPTDDLVSNRPGTRFGPRAIRQAIDAGGPPRLWHLDLGVDPFAELVIVDHGDAEVVPGDAYATHRALREAVARIVRAGGVPVVLGGDHSIAYPDISAVAEARGRRLGVIQFDTHADTASEIWGVEWSHGTPFRHLVDRGVIKGTDLVQIGLRGYWPNPEEFAWMRDAGIRWHRADEIHRGGIDVVVEAALAEVSGADELFLSVDIDVLDPAFAPGTGTPEPGGMSTHDLLRAVRNIVLAKGIVGLEVVEVSPPYDHADITALAAHRVVLEALSALALRKAHRHPAPQDPG